MSDFIPNCKVTVSFEGDRQMVSYWGQFTTKDEFTFLRFTKAGLCLLKDSFGKEVTMRKRNVHPVKTEREDDDLWHRQWESHRFGDS